MYPRYYSRYFYNIDMFWNEETKDFLLLMIKVMMLPYKAFSRHSIRCQNLSTYLEAKVYKYN